MFWIASGKALSMTVLAVWQLRLFTKQKHPEIFQDVFLKNFNFYT
jgi:hypothetical protein